MPRRKIISVTTPKKPSKEPPLPSQDESRRTNVLLEKLMSEFRTFGEGQSIMRERLDRMEPDLHAVKEDVAVLKIAVRTNGSDISALKDAVQKGIPKPSVPCTPTSRTSTSGSTVVEAKLAS